MIGFPLLLIPLAICNLIVFLMPGVALSAAVVALQLPSGESWSMSFADVLIALALLLLIAEMAKAVRPGKKSVVDHALAFLLFAAALAEFLLLQRFATSTFFILVVIAFVDLAGSLLVQTQRAAAVRAAAPGVSPDASIVHEEAAPVAAEPMAAREPRFDSSVAGYATGGSRSDTPYPQDRDFGSREPGR